MCMYIQKKHNTIDTSTTGFELCGSTQYVDLIKKRIFKNTFWRFLTI